MFKCYSLINTVHVCSPIVTEISRQSLDHWILRKILVLHAVSRLGMTKSRTVAHSAAMRGNNRNDADAIMYKYLKAIVLHDECN